MIEQNDTKILSNDEFRQALIVGIVRAYENNYIPAGNETPDVKYRRFYDDIIEIVKTPQPGEEQDV